MRRAPFTRALAPLVMVVGLLTVSTPAAFADDSATIGLPSIDLDFAAAAGVNGGQSWCATGVAASDAKAPVWTVTFEGTRATGLPFHSGPHVVGLSSMSVCDAMTKNGSPAGTMKVTVTYTGAFGSTPLTATGVSFWTLDGDYFSDWHN
jgi:hypothetical protein